MKTLLLALALLAPCLAVAQVKKKLVAVKPTAAFTYDSTYLNANFDDVRTRRQSTYYAVQRKNRRTPAGNLNQATVYVTATRKRLASGYVKDDSLMVGAWTFYYPSGKRLAEVICGDDGEPLPDGLHMWREDGTEACHAIQPLASDTRVLHSVGLGSSFSQRDTHDTIAVDLPAGTTHVTISYDLRNTAAPAPFWTLGLRAAGVFLNGIILPTIADGLADNLEKQVTEVSAAGYKADSTNPGGAEGYYFATTDRATAYAFIALGSKRAFELQKPTISSLGSQVQDHFTCRVPVGARRVWVCVENTHLRMTSTATVRVEAALDLCNVQAAR